MGPFLSMWIIPQIKGEKGKEKWETGAQQNSYSGLIA